MSGMLGGVPGQVAGDLLGIAESAVKQTVKAGTDVATKSMEQLTNAPSQVSAKAATEEKGGGASDPQVKAKKRADEKRRFDEVKGELASYLQHKRKVDSQAAQEKAKEEQETQQREMTDKRKRDSWASQLLKKIGGASHGETSKQKE